ncbi:MAG: hypothetical protein MJA31_10845 [Clostridia bacterium]|nr:hypothetical protein [Clostridia bacterium]
MKITQLNCIPHFSAGIVSLTANLHFAAACSNINLIELTLDENPMREKLAREPIKLSEGKLYLPDGPGLGIELDVEILNKYKLF